jgi:hypothetical protein
MVIREAGILFRGFAVVKKSYHKTSLGKIDSDLRSGLLTAILNFAESAFSQNVVEYLEGNKFTIAFIEDSIIAEDSDDPELLVTYAILDKEKKIDKHIHKVIKPLLTRVTREFKSIHSGKNLSEVSQFKDFKQNLDKIFGSDTQTIDQKFKGIF